MPRIELSVPPRSAWCAAWAKIARSKSRYRKYRYLMTQAVPYTATKPATSSGSASGASRPPARATFEGLDGADDLVAVRIVDEALFGGVTLEEVGPAHPVRLRRMRRRLEGAATDRVAPQAAPAQWRAHELPQGALAGKAIDLAVHAILEVRRERADMMRVHR